MIRGDLTAREFIALWTTEGLVVADMNVNIWDVTDEIQPLIPPASASIRSVWPTRRLS
ncbi:hypothetical protein ACWKSP_17775 [Micromonosporaceae bacterium Da 78-11]